MTLHPDQEEALAKVDAAYAEGAHGPLLCAATGFGKTHCAVKLINRWHRRNGQKTWFLAHLKELLDDTENRLISNDIPYGWIRSGKPVDKSAFCQLVSLQTAVKRLDDLPQPDVVIIDECDLAVAPSYQKILDAIGRPRILGLTGTPIRTDGRPMSSGGFDRLILTPNTIDLVESGRLSRLRMWTFDPPSELLRVTSLSGNRDEEAGAIMSKRYILDDALSHWKRLAVEPYESPRPTAVFCHSVPAAESTAQEWRDAGFRAMAVHGNSSAEDRSEALHGLREGRLDAVMTADLWIAGVDVKQIACILCLRHTDSLRVWLQMVGRGLRLCEEWPDCLLLDCVGNLRNKSLGNPLARRMHLWTLDGIAKSRGIPLLPHIPYCQNCFSCDVVGGVCRECGHRQELRLPHGPKIIKGQLMEIDARATIRSGKDAEKLARQKQRIEEERKCKTYDEFVRLGHERGYSSPEGWARHKVQIRQRWRTRSPLPA